MRYNCTSIALHNEPLSCSSKGPVASIGANEGVTNGLCEHSRACEHCDFFASMSRNKKIALRASSSLEGTTRELPALLIFSACSNSYMEILFFKMKQKIYQNGILI